MHTREGKQGPHVIQVLSRKGVALQRPRAGAFTHTLDRHIGTDAIGCAIGCAHASLRLRQQQVYKASSNIQVVLPLNSIAASSKTHGTATNGHEQLHQAYCTAVGISCNGLQTSVLEGFSAGKQRV